MHVIENYPALSDILEFFIHIKNVSGLTILYHNDKIVAQDGM